MNSMKLVIPFPFISWKKNNSKRCCDTTTPESIHTQDERKRGSTFAFIFGVNWPVQWLKTEWRVSWNSCLANDVKLFLVSFSSFLELCTYWATSPKTTVFISETKSWMSSVTPSSSRSLNTKLSSWEEILKQPTKFCQQFLANKEQELLISWRNRYVKFDFVLHNFQGCYRPIFSYFFLYFPIF